MNRFSVDFINGSNQIETRYYEGSETLAEYGAKLWRDGGFYGGIGASGTGFWVIPSMIRWIRIA